MDDFGDFGYGNFFPNLLAFKRASHCDGPGGESAGGGPLHHALGPPGAGPPADASAEGHQVPTSGGPQQPAASEVVASLLKFCPPGEEGTVFFRAAFTMRLPVAIQVHLTGTELTDLKELAQMADRLWLCHGPKSVVAVSVEEGQSEDDSSEVVAAIPARRRPQHQHGHPKGQQGQQATGGTAAMARTSAGGIRGMERALFAVLTRRTARARAAIRTWWPTANLGPLMCSPCPGLPRWPAYRCPLGHWPPLWQGMGVQGPLMWQW